MTQPNAPGAPLTAGDIATLDFDKTGGLLPAVVQHAQSGEVLMLGYMNREALRETFTRRRVVFFSRSRGRLWEKGETSGHTLRLAAVRTDCDRDTLLVTAVPAGPVCHLGTATCFGDATATAAGRLAFLGALEGVIAQRIADRPEGSYTARIYAAGPKRIAQKVGEEGLEVALAAVAETDDKLVAESADLLYHLLLLLESRGLRLEHVVAELESRHAGRGPAAASED
ncbi:MAG: bifunctional phosphoribosyl-AMP cyclohydrolase/phosphoribosyl-ATP diphosphatase HisIE [Gammaproteobacteria bacterium]|nr:bifunctional phosphoribosyl-AMP cyclohydrolase/phosphoribosyl-ATP diphosphatase HisIE [Gammaproteobacteria bacterium]MDE2263986.1 bifunctional phosphoribosyl-AMP cyclohydrolase/phosphoribosyl-ATP diphosphatase HisIE [Gammaproteobacteria bacterium]